jgi:hypothetical protein
MCVAVCLLAIYTEQVNQITYVFLLLLLLLFAGVGLLGLWRRDHEGVSSSSSSTDVAQQLQQ